MPVAGITYSPATAIGRGQPAHKLPITIPIGWSGNEEEVRVVNVDFANGTGTLATTTGWYNLCVVAHESQENWIRVSAQIDTRNTTPEGFGTVPMVYLYARKSFEEGASLTVNIKVIWQSKAAKQYASNFNIAPDGLHVAFAISVNGG